MTESRGKRRIAKPVIWCCATVAVVLILLWALHRPSLDVVHQWEQPASITYDDWGPYYLSVVESDLDWRGFPLHVERNHFIYVGRDAGSPAYGHMVDFSFHPYPEDLERFLDRAEVEWTAAGVLLELPSGHRLFIPADMFTGGR